MFSPAILRRLLIPTWCGASAVVYAKKKDEPPTCDDARKLVKASELPLYTDDKKCGKCETKEDLKPSVLTESISCARKELWFLMDQARIISDQAMDYFDVAKAHSESALEFLREESNIVPRMGAIGIGGLTGFVVGLRRGPIRRLFYSTLGTAAIAALAYPKEAEEYTYIGLKLARKYVIISYHFLNGVSRDLTGYQLPRLGGRLGGDEGSGEENSVVVISIDGDKPSEVHVPSSTKLLPPTASATHILMPHEHHDENETSTWYTNLTDEVDYEKLEEAESPASTAEDDKCVKNVNNTPKPGNTSCRCPKHSTTTKR